MAGSFEHGLRILKTSQELGISTLEELEAEISGPQVYDDDLRAMDGGSLKHLPGVARLISNFVVFPRHGLAEINFDPGVKVVRLTESENAQGTPDGSAMPAIQWITTSSGSQRSIESAAWRTSSRAVALKSTPCQ